MSVSTMIKLSWWVLQVFNYIIFHQTIWCLCIYELRSEFFFTNNLITEPFHLAYSNLFMPFLLDQLSMHSSILEKMLSFAAWKFTDAGSLHYSLLQNILWSLLFLICHRSPVTIWPWFLSIYGELIQLHEK